MTSLESGQLNIATSQISWNPIVVPTPRTSFAYSFYDTGKLFLRKNNGTNMADVIYQPEPGNTPNGWYVSVLNLDDTANLTITPVDCLINNGADVTIKPLESLRISSDGVNFYASRSISTSQGSGVQGIPPTVVNAIARFDSTNADLIQGSQILIDDDGVMTGVNRISITDGS